ncbi:MAG: hypothetical protein IKL36_03570 [Clostridia bacterium]|nr:hypothetical protein [Clostridia bacterium]
MSRYKVVKPKDHKQELKKKRNRILSAVEIIYVSLMLIALIIGGINQSNNTTVGIVLIIMGVISVPTAIFYIYIDIKGWEPPFWYDAPDISPYVSKKQKDEDLSKFLFFKAFITIFLVLLSIGLPILGILKILQII